MSDNHDKGTGRFVAGNRARAKRQDLLAPAELGKIFDGALIEFDPEKRDFHAALRQIVAHALVGALNGDREYVKFVVERFSPQPRAPRIRIRGLPKPSRDPMGFLDKLAAEVAASRLAVDDAAKLARLVAPLVSDAQLRQMAADLEELRARVDARERRPRQGSGVGPQVIPFRS